jgi:prolyl oligopeptidase
MLPPRARVEVVQDTYFGTKVADPYRWLEDWQGAEARSWLDAQAAATREYLDALPERAALLARIGELSNAAPNLSRFQVAGGRTFYLRRDPGENLAKLVVRLTPQADEQVLVDPNGMGGQVHTALDWYRPSRDGRRVAYGMSQGGSEESTLAVLEVDSGRRHDLAISRTRFGGVSWLADHQSFVYHRLAEYPAGTPPTERYINSRCYLHRVQNELTL